MFYAAVTPAAPAQLRAGATPRGPPKHPRAAPAELVDWLVAQEEPVKRR
jgi:hypothetical protein